MPCESDLSLALTLDVSDGCNITMLRNSDDNSQTCYVKLSVNEGQEFEFAHTSISAEVGFCIFFKVAKNVVYEHRSMFSFLCRIENHFAIKNL